MATEQRRTRAAAGTTRRAKAAPKADVIDIDFEGYEPPRSEYMGEDPRPGVYRFSLQSVARHTSENSGNDSIRWIFSCEDEPYAGWAGFMYTGADTDADNWFRTQNVVRAVQGGSTKKVSLNLDDPEAFLKACKVVLGRVKGEEYNGEIRGKLATVAPDDGSVKSSTVTEEDDLEDEDEYDDEDEDIEDDDAEEGDAEDDEEDEEDDEDEDAEDDEDDEEEDEEEEEPEPEPAPRRRRSAPASAKAAAKAPAKKVAPRQRRAR